MEATLSGRMGFYSKKYDILLGGSMIDPNSRYQIDTSKPKKQCKFF